MEGRACSSALKSLAIEPVLASQSDCSSSYLHSPSDRSIVCDSKSLVRPADLTNESRSSETVERTSISKDNTVRGCIPGGVRLIAAAFL